MSRRLPLACVLLVLISLQPNAPRARGAPRQPTLGKAPTTCPATPPSAHFSSRFGPGWGGPLVWAVGLGANQNIYVRGWPHATYSPPRNGRGWGSKVLWVVALRVPGKVTLRGWNLRTGKHVYFRTNSVTTTLRLDARASRAITHNTGPYEGFPSTVFFPSAGCYVLYTQWRTGSWVVPVAFGR